MIIAMRSANKSRHWAAGLGYLVGRTARLIWDWRLELGLVVAALATYLLTTSLPIWVVAPIWAAAVLAMALDVHLTERLPRLSLRRNPRGVSYLHQRVSGSRMRRSVERASRESGIYGLRVECVSPTLPGELIKVRVGRGQTVDKLENSSRALAASMRVADVRVVHDRADRSRAEVSVIRRDPFARMHEMAWPLINATQTNIREPMPIGLDEYGRLVTCRLLSRNLLVGGAPDSGKSTFLRLPAAYAALDPNVRSWMMDGKRVEFEPWRTCARGFVSGRDLKAAAEMLTELYEMVDERYRQIVAAGEVFVLDDMKLDVLMIDELPVYTRSAVGASGDDGKLIKLIHGLLYAIIAQGRAAGVITILSAQKPDANTVPTDIRDLVDNKLALHCNTKAMSDTIIGSGAGEESTANAADIPSGQPGVGYYVGDEGVLKTKIFYIAHKQALEVASRVAGSQMDAELQAMA